MLFSNTMTIRDAWGEIPDEQVPQVVLGLKLWQLEAEPQIAGLDRRLIKQEAATEDFKAQLAEAATSVKTAVKIFAALWVASVTLLGLWFAARGH